MADEDIVESQDETYSSDGVKEAIGWASYNAKNQMGKIDRFINSSSYENEEEMEDLLSSLKSKLYEACTEFYCQIESMIEGRKSATYYPVIVEFGRYYHMDYDSKNLKIKDLKNYLTAMNQFIFDYGITKPQTYKKYTSFKDAMARGKRI